MLKNSIEYFAGVMGNNTYLMADSLDDRKRLELQVKLAAPAFKQAIGQALDKFGLRAKLQDPQATFRVLDAGCGEGLYFPVLANFLAEQGAKARIVIVGVDRDEAAIATAQDYMEALGLPDMEFYQHDLTKPLKELEGLDLTNPKNHFDLAFSIMTLMHISNAHQTLGYIYDVLKSGGGFYTRDITLTWDTIIYPSPTFTGWCKMIGQLMLKMVGADFAPQQAEHIAAAGFEAVSSFESNYPMGGRTELGRHVLQDLLLIQHSTRAIVLKLGLMSEAAYDEMMEQEFREISADIEGSVVINNSIARRPL